MTSYRITVLTPMLVSDGYKLAPIDYMVWKDHVNVLDQTRIFKLLAKGPRLEGYLTQLRKAEKLDFASWGGFAQNYAERRIPFEHSSMTEYWNGAYPEDLHIPTFASGTSGPYLPASALKGALKTSWVFAKWNEGVVREIAGRMEGERPVRRPGEAAEAMTLGSPASSPLRGAVIGDSAPVQPNVFKVYLVRTATLEPRGEGRYQVAWKIAPGRNSARHESSKPVFVEMAKPGSAFSGTLKWHGNKVLTAANDHASELLALQKRYAEQAGLDRVRASVESLESRLSEIRGRRDACLLNIGWAGGFLSKAGFLDTSNDDYRKLLGRLPYYERAIRTGLPFPKTRRIVFEQNQPSALPGWAVLELG